MRQFDWSDLNANLLRLLVAVVETGSITAASDRLGVTQSAVSHLLNKLRAIANDPLFVKSGRGIVATSCAVVLASQARELLSDMERFARSAKFDPAQWHTELTIAANDFQRDLLLPALYMRLQSEAPGVVLRVIASGVPTLEMLRDEHCQLAISPRPPDGSDILQKRLFVDRYRVFFDPKARNAPKSKLEYLAANHVTVIYEPTRALDLDQWMMQRGIHRRFAVMVPGFAGLSPFLSGSQMLATVPGMLRARLMRDLASAEVPLATPTMPMYMIWHLRHQHDPAHQWLRRMLEVVTQDTLSRLAQLPAEK